MVNRFLEYDTGQWYHDGDHRGDQVMEVKLHDCEIQQVQLGQDSNDDDGELFLIVVDDMLK